VTDGDLAQPPAIHAPECRQCGLVHPGAGCGGNVPPVETRWQPGVSPNPTGKPKGSFSARQRGRNKWAADPDADGIGKRAAEAWDALEQAAFDGDLDRVRALSIAIEQLEGKPVEHVVRTDNRIRTVVVKPGESTPPPMP
jgi:hypothetical protein